MNCINMVLDSSTQTFGTNGASISYAFMNSSDMFFQIIASRKSFATRITNFVSDVFMDHFDMYSQIRFQFKWFCAIVSVTFEISSVWMNRHNMTIQNISKLEIFSTCWNKRKNLTAYFFLWNKPRYSESCVIVNKTQLPFCGFTKHITFDIVNYLI